MNDLPKCTYCKKPFAEDTLYPRSMYCTPCLKKLGIDRADRPSLPGTPKCAHCGESFATDPNDPGVYCAGCLKALDIDRAGEPLNSRHPKCPVDCDLRIEGASLHCKEAKAFYPNLGLTQDQEDRGISMSPGVDCPRRNPDCALCGGAGKIPISGSTQFRSCGGCLPKEKERVAIKTRAYYPCKGCGKSLYRLADDTPYCHSCLWGRIPKSPGDDPTDEGDVTLRPGESLVDARWMIIRDALIVLGISPAIETDAEARGMLLGGIKVLKDARDQLEHKVHDYENAEVIPVSSIRGSIGDAIDAATAKLRRELKDAQPLRYEIWNYSRFSSDWVLVLRCAFKDSAHIIADLLNQRFPNLEYEVKDRNATEEKPDGK